MAAQHGASGGITTCAAAAQPSGGSVGRRTRPLVPGVRVSRHHGFAGLILQRPYAAAGSTLPVLAAVLGFWPPHIFENAWVRSVPA
jgi:hypothetical protein